MSIGYASQEVSEDSSGEKIGLLLDARVFQTTSGVPENARIRYDIGKTGKMTDFLQNLLKLCQISQYKAYCVERIRIKRILAEKQSWRFCNFLGAISQLRRLSKKNKHQCFHEKAADTHQICIRLAESDRFEKLRETLL